MSRISSSINEVGQGLASSRITTAHPYQNFFFSLVIVLLGFPFTVLYSIHKNGLELGGRYHEQPFRKRRRRFLWYEYHHIWRGRNFRCFFFRRTCNGSLIDTRVFERVERKPRKHESVHGSLGSLAGTRTTDDHCGKLQSLP